MAPIKKTLWRDVALLNALTPGLLPPLTWTREGYEQYIGCKLNRAELLNQQAGVIFTGTSYAHSLEDIPGDIFLALCDDEATAFELMVKANNARSDARVSRETANPGGMRTRRLFG